MWAIVIVDKSKKKTYTQNRTYARSYLHVIHIVREANTMDRFCVFATISNGFGNIKR